MMNTSLRVLERSFGGLETQGRGFRTDPCIGMSVQRWKSKGINSLIHLGNDYSTRDFVSTEKDVHRHVRKSIQFAATACNTNSLVAIATESGMIHLVDTAEDAAFDRCHIMISVLDNAVTDIAFSSDDSHLAVGCGDKSMRLIDMQTQKTKMVFQDHWGCIKQVRFRPGDDNVIATCCRDGIINLWDTRCKGEMRPVVSGICHGDIKFGSPSVSLEYKAEFQLTPHRTWRGAHSDRLNMSLLNGRPNASR
jgi:WD40 repeat protein